MKGIIIVLIILLALSITNNYLLYKKKTSNHKLTFNYIDTSYLPSNIGFINYTFFYNKDDKYKMCHVDDFRKNKNSSKEPYMKIELNDLIKNLKKKYINKCAIIKNESNEQLNISDNQILILNSLSKKL